MVLSSRFQGRSDYGLKIAERTASCQEAGDPASQRGAGNPIADVEGQSNVRGHGGWPMRAGKLRAMVDRGGVPGALLVGGYLILHYAWHRRRPRLLIVVV